MKPTDPNFGADFDADLFRSAITSTMQMGMPLADGEPTQECIFIWNDQNTFDSVDQEGNPYDFAAKPTTTISHPDVKIPVAIDITPSDDKGASSLGEFDQVKAILTILDVHYEQVKGADMISLGGSLYTIDYTAPPQGLFDVNIYTMYITSLDES